jgi:hypothetical protein
MSSLKDLHYEIIHVLGSLNPYTDTLLRMYSENTKEDLTHKTVLLFDENNLEETYKKLKEVHESIELVHPGNANNRRTVALKRNG